MEYKKYSKSFVEKFKIINVQQSVYFITNISKHLPDSINIKPLDYHQM